MKNIKEIIIGIFAVIGVLALVTGFTNNATQQMYATPESRVWSFYMDSSSTLTYAYAINAVTGEVRKYNSHYTGAEGKSANANFDLYRVTKEK